MIKVYGEVYGCTANKADHEIILGLLKNAGMKIVDSPNKSDINLITTCAVKSPTVNRMIFRSKELTKLNKPLIVAGCLSKIDKERRLIEKINPRASFVGPDSITKIVDVVQKTLNGRIVFALEKINEEKVNLPHIRNNPIIDIAEINSGCLSSCVFCATKLARGDIFSYRPYSIREHIKQAIVEGCKEIWLTSQDCSAYGRDIGTNLAELLESITQIEGKFFVRVGMMNPLHFKKVEIRKLINIYKNEKIYKFLHLCVQSGSNKVLRVMKRGYSIENFMDYVELFRKEIPEMTLCTDVIVGHPGEEDDDFKDTMQLIKKLKPDIVNISKFGSRPGTIAEKMKQIPYEIIDERSKKISKLVRNIAYEQNNKWCGWEGDVLINKINGEFSVGSNYAYKPVIVNSKLELGNNFVKVKITKVKGNYLVGRIVQ